MIHTQSEAKAFFADKVIQRARSEGLTLSAAEREMLSWSESDPEFIANPQLASQLSSEMSDEQYETKVAGLLKRSFDADVAADPQAREIWQKARSVLEQGDHYILIMVDQAVGAKLKSWWEFWR